MKPGSFAAGSLAAGAASLFGAALLFTSPPSLQASQCGGPGKAACRTETTCIGWSFLSYCTTTTYYWSNDDDVMGGTILVLRPAAPTGEVQVLA